ncbi:hypothetical protein D1815_06380 [Aquimarina sp. AD1]|uniref:hypothetical protein n=1 Tax=Aquimarina sp. (strain AD1) TaxID=1714848 RepID=UPI000E4AA2D6|nr:hypothetical protein [Aquimarina sp. AD1]AXT55401.1 hypothetical protein D1815_06380 [Aquimarina sp. AD1]
MIKFSINTIKLFWLCLLISFCTSSCKSQKRTISEIKIEPIEFSRNCENTGSSLKYRLPIVKNYRQLDEIIIKKLIDDEFFLFVNSDDLNEVNQKSLQEVIKYEFNLAKLNCNSDDALSTSKECDYEVYYNSSELISIQFSLATIQSGFDQFYINLNYDIGKEEEFKLSDIIDDKGLDFLLKESNNQIDHILENYLSDSQIDIEERNELKSLSSESDYKLSSDSLKDYSFLLINKNGKDGIELDYDFPFDSRIINVLGKPELFFDFSEIKRFLKLDLK